MAVRPAPMPDGSVREREIVLHPGSAAVLAMDEEGGICLLRQWRHAADGWIWEIPAGKLDKPGETPLDAAKRELAEEAGLRAESWTGLGRMHSSPGFCDEVIHLFLAKGLSKVQTAHEPGEFIETRMIQMDKALEMAQKGEITDAKTIAALFRASGRT